MEQLSFLAFAQSRRAAAAVCPPPAVNDDALPVVAHRPADSGQGVGTSRVIRVSQPKTWVLSGLREDFLLSTVSDGLESCMDAPDSLPSGSARGRMGVHSGRYFDDSFCPRSGWFA